MNTDKIYFDAFKRHYSNIDSMEKLTDAKKAFSVSYKKLGIYKPTVYRFLNAKSKEFKNNSLNVVISDAKELKPLKFDLKGLDKLESNINKLNDLKLKYEFEGLFNLLSDKCNLLYNPLWVRQQIIKDLNKFKSLKFFKVNYLSRYDLKKEYKKFTFKNDSSINHSKIYFIKSGLYLLKTLKKDDISLKVFYVGNKHKTLLNKHNTYKRVLKGKKYNLSSTEAYKVLDKKDNIKYYSYCNSIGLDKKNRQLLRSIKSSKRISRDSLIESLEDRMEDLKDNINNKVLSETNKIYLELQIQDIEESLSNLKSYDEDNSLEGETTLNDYF